MSTKQTDSVAPLAALLHQVVPWAALVNLDEFSDEDRGRFRELVGQEQLFDLSNHLNALCSRWARQVAQTGRRLTRQAMHSPRITGRWSR